MDKSLKRPYPFGETQETQPAKIRKLIRHFGVCPTIGFGATIVLESEKGQRLTAEHVCTSNYGQQMVISCTPNDGKKKIDLDLTWNRKKQAWQDKWSEAWYKVVGAVRGGVLEYYYVDGQKECPDAAEKKALLEEEQKKQAAAAAEEEEEEEEEEEDDDDDDDDE